MPFPFNGHWSHSQLRLHLSHIALSAILHFQTGWGRLDDHLPSKHESCHYWIACALCSAWARSDGLIDDWSCMDLPAQGVRRTSNLLAPTMLLTGHGGEVFTVKFSPDGEVVASGSHDRQVLLWRTFEECENFMLISGEYS